MAWFNFIYTDIGRLLACFIIGLGLSLMLRSVCDGPECIIIEGPPIKEVEDKIFKFDDKCYSYKAVIAQCQNEENDENNKTNKD